MYFPKLFDDFSTISIDSPLQTLDLHLVEATENYRNKYQRHIQGFQKFLLKMMIEAKKIQKRV